MTTASRAPAKPQSALPMPDAALSKNALIIAVLLALLMAATRPHPIGALTHLPDASIAIFFAAGFYLGRWLLFAFYCSLAALLDFLSITAGGVSSFCATPAYGFLIPTYAVAWQAGILFKEHYALTWRSALIFAALALAAASIAFIISNGSFYLLSGYYGAPDWSEYRRGFGLYYPYYVISALAYILALGLIHVGLQYLRKTAQPERPEYGHAATGLQRQKRITKTAR